MIEDAAAGISRLLGLNAETLTFWQTTVRAVVVYVAALAMVRLGDKRFLGKHTAFDVVLGVIFGSVVSRAITRSGDASFFAILLAGLVLVGLHWLFSGIAFRSDRFGALMKGNVRTLIRDGRFDWDAMRKTSMSKEDLLAALRLQAHFSEPDRVEAAHLERNGDVSIIPRRRDPHVVEVTVAAGVQTVRIELQ